MKVAELIAELQQLPPDADVILQKDSEGNGYSPLSVVDGSAIYVADSTYSGDVYSTEWTAEDACMSESEWEDFKNSNQRCVILAPVN
jgi:hypothetical protein